MSIFYFLIFVQKRTCRLKKIAEKSLKLLSKFSFYERINTDIFPNRLHRLKACCWCFSSSHISNIVNPMRSLKKGEKETQKRSFDNFFKGLILIFKKKNAQLERFKYEVWMYIFCFTVFQIVKARCERCGKKFVF